MPIRHAAQGSSRTQRKTSTQTATTTKLVRVPGVTKVPTSVVSLVTPETWTVLLLDLDMTENAVHTEANGRQNNKLPNIAQHNHS